MSKNDTSRAQCVGLLPYTPTGLTRKNAILAFLWARLSPKQARMKLDVVFNEARNKIIAVVVTFAHIHF